MEKQQPRGLLDDDDFDVHSVVWGLQMPGRMGQAR